MDKNNYIYSTTYDIIYYSTGLQLWGANPLPRYTSNGLYFKDKNMLLLPLLKRCHTCKINKVLIEFNKNKSRKDGYQGQCKLCRKQYYLNNLEHIKQYCINNYDKRKQNKKQWCIDNAEHLTQYRLDNADKINQYGKQWLIDNAEHRKQYYQQYCQTQQGKLSRKAIKHKRRALLKANTSTGKHWKPEDIVLKLKLQKYKCVYCQVSIKEYHEIEHFIPLCKGGSNEPSNIQLLCQECNRGKDGKGTKLPHEFAQQHGMLL